MSEHDERARVVSESMTWAGTPYHHMGRVKGAGVDCGMLLLEVYERAGILPHVEPKPYPQDWHMHREEERYFGHVQALAEKVDAPQPGDVALFRFGKCISHGAIVIEWPQVIHAYVPTGKVVLDDAEKNTDLAKRLVGFWSPWAKRKGAE